MKNPTRFISFLIALLLIASAHRALAQAQTQRIIVRYPLGAANTNFEQLKSDITQTEGTIVREMNFIKHGFVGAAAVFPIPNNVQTVLTAKGYLVRNDARIVRNSGAGVPPTNGWQLNCLWPSAPPATDPCADAPVLYIVDTGIVSSHADFTAVQSSGKLEFLPGLSYGLILNPFPLPTPSVPPYQDAYDHGTRLAGVVAGSTTGLLSKLGAKVKIKSVNCYDVNPSGAGFPGTWVSTCTSAIYGVIDDHNLRLDTTAYLRNHASVMLFAQSTEIATGHEGDLDIAVDEARKAGIHVVIAAGNQGTVPVDAAAVSPVGAAFAYKVGANPPVRWWWGALPGGATYVRVPATGDNLFIVGAHDSTNAMWASSNRNTAAAAAVDYLAPGVAIYAPSSLGGYGTYDGTSYGSANMAATLAYVLGRKPWAKPSEVKLTIPAANIVVGTMTYKRLQVPTPANLSSLCLTYANWLAHYGLTTPNDLASADPDFDGMTNMQEYTCGTDPRFSDIAYNATITATPSSGKVKFSLPLACYACSPNPITITFQESTNLTTWTNLSYTLTASNVHVGDGLIYNSNQITSASVSRKFYRVKFSGVL